MAVRGNDAVCGILRRGGIHPMSNCPVCGRAGALILGTKRAPGTRVVPWTISCSRCRIPFEIDGKDLNLAVSNTREFEIRRRRWKQILGEAVQRGEKRARLY